MKTFKKGKVKKSFSLMDEVVSQVGWPIALKISSALSVQNCFKVFKVHLLGM